MNSNKQTVKDASYFQTAGTLLLAGKEWASIPEQFPYGLGVLIFNFLMYQSELIPRWLSVWGLVGGVLVVAMGVSRLIGRPMFLLAIPIVLNELVLAVWLIVVGFEPATIVSTIVGVLFINLLLISRGFPLFIHP